LFFVGLVLWVRVGFVVVCWVGGVVVVILVGVEGGVEGFIVEKSMLYGVGVLWSGLTTNMTTSLTDRFVQRVLTETMTRVHVILADR
jgi:hypothetical protein